MLKWFKRDKSKQEEEKEQDGPFPEETDEAGEDETDESSEPGVDVRDEDLADDDFVFELDTGQIVDEQGEILVEELPFELEEPEEEFEEPEPAEEEPEEEEAWLEPEDVPDMAEAQEEAEELFEDMEEGAALPEPETPEEKKKGFFARLKEKLSGTRALLNTRVDHLLLGKKEIDEDILDELEEILVTSDLGIRTAQDLLKTISVKIARKELNSGEKVKQTLREEMTRILALPAHERDRSIQPYVIMVVGVNGVGKTTTIAKLARRFKSEGEKVMLVAGDTFRAAAVEQLSIWADRVGVEIVKQQTGSDPSAVVFDALNAAKARKIDTVIIDTAGRLHTKVNLMEELKKVNRIAGRELAGSPHEVLLVLDATTGQNAVSQAKLFNEAVSVSSIAMTKLDGTAKGGVLVAICNELKIPIKYIGIGERMDDLRDFDADAFIGALFE